MQCASCSVASFGSTDELGDPDGLVELELPPMLATGGLLGALLPQPTNATALATSTTAVSGPVRLDTVRLDTRRLDTRRRGPPALINAWICIFAYPSDR
jgi:hypothetical protein